MSYCLREGHFMGKLYLIRHGQAEGNLYHRVHGWYDSKLTALGTEQARLLGERLSSVSIQHIYASDLTRAKETVRPLAAPRGLPILEDAGLREIHMGIYEDAPIGELQHAIPDDYALFRGRSPRWQAPDGEAFRQVQERMTKTFFRLAQLHSEETVALVSHKAAIHTLQAALHGLPPHEYTAPAAQNTALSCYEVSGSKFRILFENDSSHLPRDSASPAPSLWFRPALWSRDEDFYRAARRDAWLTVHSDLLDFDGPAYLQEAKEQALWEPRAVQIAMLEDKPVGLLQLSTLSGAQAGVGRVPFLWVDASLRRQGLGSQLLGQAISTYRGMGRSALRLQCAPKNAPAQSFYRKHGFRKIGDVPALYGTLDLLERPL